MKIRTRLMVSFLALALIPLVIAGAVVFLLVRNSVEAQVLRQLQSTAAIQKERVQSLLDLDRARLSLISTRISVLDGLAAYQATGDPTRLEQVSRSLETALASTPEFRQISVLGLDGTVLASTNPEDVGTNESSSSFFQKGRQEPFVGDFFTGPGDKLMHYVSGPLTVDGEKIGVIAIETDSSDITSLMNDYTGLGKSGETVIATRTADGDALFLGATRFGSGKPLSTVVSGSESNVPMNIALNGKTATLKGSVDYRGIPVLAFTEHIDDPPLGLVVKMDRSEAFATVNNILLVFTGLLAGLAVLVVLASYLLSRSITRPIGGLTGAAEAIAGGELSRRAKVERDDELGLLAGAFNKMTDDLVAERNSLEQKVEERTAELERSNAELDGYAHTVSHDLRGPISAINLSATLMRDELESPGEGSREELLEFVGDIEASTRRAFDLASDLLALAEAGQEPRQVENVDIDDVVDKILHERAERMREKNARVVVDGKLGTVVANDTHVYQLFSNLIINAVKHNNSDEPVIEVLRLEAFEAGGGRYEVRDNGPGIAEAEFDHIFEPFFKGRGGETGVGLATVKKIVELYGGTIKARNLEGGGASFEFVLEGRPDCLDSDG